MLILPDSVIPAGTLYFIYVVVDAVYHKRYFYSSVNMQMTQVALAHSIVLGTMLCREPATLDVSLHALCRTMISWSTFLTKPATSSECFPLPAPSLTANALQGPPVPHPKPTLPSISQALPTLRLF